MVCVRVSVRARLCSCVVYSSGRGGRLSQVRCDRHRAGVIDGLCSSPGRRGPPQQRRVAPEAV